MCLTNVLSHDVYHHLWGSIIIACLLTLTNTVWHIKIYKVRCGSDDLSLIQQLQAAYNKIKHLCLLDCPADRLHVSCGMVAKWKAAFSHFLHTLHKAEAGLFSLNISTETFDYCHFFFDFFCNILTDMFCF